MSPVYMKTPCDVRPVGLFPKLEVFYQPYLVISLRPYIIPVSKIYLELTDLIN